MPHYKDINNNLHFLDDPKFLHLLPEGTIEITDEEAKAIREKSIVPASNVPSSVTRYQAMAALMQAGYLAEIDAYIAALPIVAVDKDADPVDYEAIQKNTENQLIKLAWKEALTFDRKSPMTVAIGAAAGLTDAQIDDLFVFAATIQ